MARSGYVKSRQDPGVEGSSSSLLGVSRRLRSEHGCPYPRDPLFLRARRRAALRSRRRTAEHHAPLAESADQPARAAARRQALRSQPAQGRAHRATDASCCPSRGACRTTTISCSAGAGRSSAIGTLPCCESGVVAAGAGTLTTAAIAATMQAIPQARIEMRRLGFFDVADELEGGRVDVVFAPWPMRLPPRVRAEPLWREAACARRAAPITRSPAASRSRSSRPNDEVFVSVAGRRRPRSWTGGSSTLDPTARARSAGPTADSVEGLLELVAAGAGVNIAGQSAQPALPARRAGVHPDHRHRAGDDRAVQPERLAQPDGRRRSARPRRRCRRSCDATFH